MIPKIIHQIWIGKNPFPDECYLYCQKWKTLYPEFEYILWDNSKVNSSNIIPEDKTFLYNLEYYPIALKADVLRYEIIRQYGGLYVDIDMEPLRKMPDEFFQLNFIGGIQNNGEVAIGLFAASLQEKLICEVCNSVVLNIQTELLNGISIENVQKLTGPEFFNKICKKYFNEPKYKFLDSKYCYPYWITEKHRKNENFYKTCPEAYSVHHWRKNWFE